MGNNEYEEEFEVEGQEENEQESAFGSAEEFDSDKHAVQKTAPKKTAIVIVIAGIVITALTILLWPIIMNGGTGATNGTYEPPNNSWATPVPEKTKPAVQVSSSGGIGDNSSGTSNQGWTEIEQADGVEYSESNIETEFTVTDIKYFAKEANGGNTILMKATVYGALNGFDGKYEIDIPYSYAVKMTAGSKFTVTVIVGKYMGKDVVDGIKW